MKLGAATSTNLMKNNIQNQNNQYNMYMLRSVQQNMPNMPNVSIKVFILSFFLFNLMVLYLLCECDCIGHVGIWD